MLPEEKETKFTFPFGGKQPKQDKEVESASILRNFVTESKFEKFNQELRALVNKCKYRKVLEEIRDKESAYDSIRYRWQLIDLKLTCMNKIVNRKFVKYSGNRIKGLETWLLRADQEIEKWFEDLIKQNTNKQDNLENTNTHQLELIMKYLLLQCYNYALFAKHEKQVADSAGFLALGERLIKFIVDYTTDPNTLNVIEKILLFSSSLLIADSDFETAKRYQSNALKICYRELYSRVDIDEGVYFESLPRAEQHYLEKCFANIVIGFYHRGVCEENLGNLIKAIESYKQGKWFSSNFLNFSIPEISSFLEDVESRAIRYNILLKIVKENEVDFKMTEKKEMKKIEGLFFKEEDNIHKYESTKKIIQKLKYHELDDNEFHKRKSENVNFIMSTVKTVNKLMSKKFRSLVNSLSEVWVSKMDKETKDKIQKRINEVKADHLFLENENNQNIDESRKRDKTQESIHYDPHPNKVIQEDKPSYILSKDLKPEGKTCTEQASKPYDGGANLLTDTKIEPTRPATCVNTERKIQNFQDTNSSAKTLKKNINSITDRSSTQGPIRKRPMTSSLSRFDTIARYKTNPYIYNQDYQNKVKYLNGIYNKEIVFQKKALENKKNERIYVENLDYKKIDLDCELFFKKLLYSKRKLYRDDEKTNKKKEILLEENRKLDVKKSIMHSKVIKSLDLKCYSKYLEFIKENEFPKSSLRDKYKLKYNVDNYNVDFANKKNRDKLDRLEHDIDELNKFEDFAIKNMMPHKVRKKNKQVKYQGNDYYKSMEHFI